MSIILQTAKTDALRYARSPWVWLLMLAGPVFARVWIPGEGDATSVIVVNDAAPVLTSSTLGLSLGVVVSALLLPLCYIFLRAGPTRRQAWQVQDVTPARRTPIALGHWAADVGLFALVLLGLSLAGSILGYVMMPAGQLNIVQIIVTLWLTALPALALMAGLRSMFSALRWTRGGLGDFGFFIFWMLGIILGGILVSEGQASPFFDYSGAFTPIMANVIGDDVNIGIGASPTSGKTIALDVLTPMLAGDYIASRIFWLIMGALLAALGGLIYQSPLQKAAKKPGLIGRYFSPAAKPVTVNMSAPAASNAHWPWLSLFSNRAKSIMFGRVGLSVGMLIALSGLFLPFDKVVSPAALLLLILGSTTHLARDDARGMMPLLSTLSTPPWARRMIDGLTIIALSIGMAVPAQVRAGTSDSNPLLIAVITGAVVAGVSVGLGAATRSAFAARLLLLIGWYGYISAT
jgi:hypothetical protein